MKWKVLSSQYLFNDLWFKVRKDRCESPQGKIIDPYYVYEFPTWVTALAITEDNKVILERQYRHGLGRVDLELPGGCVDDTDLSLQAAIERELKEETGYTFASVEYLGETSSNPSTNNNLMHMYLARGGVLTHGQSLDPNEEIEVVLTTIPELKEMLSRNEFIQSMHVSCILYGLKKLGELQF